MSLSGWFPRDVDGVGVAVLSDAVIAESALREFVNLLLMWRLWFQLWVVGLLGWNDVVAQLLLLDGLTGVARVAGNVSEGVLLGRANNVEMRLLRHIVIYR
eukprot:GEZU01033563.1.p1 GENE.GEZU01033563.1~~GEZU01033563.1.p1  ORF type:complete len:101 (+),score=9.11 GEZU01033563.1:194-496(+)